MKQRIIVPWSKTLNFLIISDKLIFCITIYRKYRWVINWADKGHILYNFNYSYLGMNLKILRKISWLESLNMVRVNNTQRYEECVLFSHDKRV